MVKSSFDVAFETDHLYKTDFKPWNKRLKCFNKRLGHERGFEKLHWINKIMNPGVKSVTNALTLCIQVYVLWMYISMYALRLVHINKHLSEPEFIPIDVKRLAFAYVSLFIISINFRAHRPWAVDYFS